jgi:hypothetical protein
MKMQQGIHNLLETVSREICRGMQNGGLFGGPAGDDF